MTLYRIKSLFPKKLRTSLYFLLPLVNKFNGRKQKKLLGNFITTGDLVFDVGANQGDMTALFLELGAKLVISIDPQPVCVSALEKRYGRDKRVAIVARGVSEQPGMLDFHLDDNSTGLASFSDKAKEDSRFAGHSWTKTIQVPVTTLDALIGQYGLPQFCKIDVEGFEPHVVKGLSRAINYISFEFSDHFFANIAEVTSHLDTLGKARYNFSMSAYYELELAEWVNSQGLLSALEKLRGKDCYGDIYVNFQK